MKYVAFFLLFTPQLLFSQADNTTLNLTLFNNGKKCNKGILKQISSIDTEFVWGGIRNDHIKFFIEEFSNFEKLLQIKVLEPQILSKRQCVQLSIIESNPQRGNSQKYIEIYEVAFLNNSTAEKVYNHINNAKIETIDWPDVSVPVKFYVKNRSLCIFLDFSDDNLEKEAELWFNKLVDRLIEKINE